MHERWNLVAHLPREQTGSCSCALDFALGAAAQFEGAWHDGSLDSESRFSTASLAPMSDIDWPLTITAIKDVLLGAAAVITASVAVVGLQRWRLELRGKADFEAARALARATYKLRDELAMCRTPFVRAHEFPPSYNSSKSRTPQQEAEGWAHMYKTRWQPVWSAIQEFDTQALEAEALWGTAAREKTQALRACVKELNVAIEAVIDDKAAGGQNFATDRELGKRMRATASASGNDQSNELSKSIASAVKGIEELLRPHLARGQ